MERNDVTGSGATRPALSAAVLRRSALAAVVVGTLLTALNHGDAILRGAWSPALWWKVPLTYLVPFLVATYGALGARGATTAGTGGRTPGSPSG